ncbi:DUF6083 domain-containing protein [Streptomyces longwoodensis]|uniref:DUF6083 domain-containing protein n=1 Tax=Streptomyces longwoodensis TaxID=68231 RepID=UPI0037022F81
MRSSPPPRRHWDGSPVVTYRARSLRVAPDSPSRLLRCAQRSRCNECGNPVEWYGRGNDRSIRLHPRELPTVSVPVDLRWHVSSGIAHPAGDGSGWCRLAHAVICPARDARGLPSASGLSGLRRALALHTRRLIDSGAFTPTVAPDSPAPPPDVCRPARPIVQLLYVRYLAAHPVDEIQCVAQTRHSNRCTQRLLTSEGPAGVWTLVPATAERGQLALPSEVTALYDLTGLPYGEQLRWRTQRCPVHAAAPSAADLAMAEWEAFDPLVHHAHIHSRLPTHVRRRGPGSPAGRGARP